MIFLSNSHGPAGKARLQSAPTSFGLRVGKGRGDGRKRGSIQLSPLSVSMAMALEAGQNFLSGNQQRLPFTTAQATLAAVLSGGRRTREGTWGLGLPGILLSAALRAAGELVKLPLKAKAGGATGIRDPFEPHWCRAGGTVTGQLQNMTVGAICLPARHVLVAAQRAGSFPRRPLP